MKWATRIGKPKWRFFSSFCSARMLNTMMSLPIKTKTKDRDNVQKQHLVNLSRPPPLVPPGTRGLVHSLALGSLTGPLIPHFQAHCLFWFFVNCLQQNNEIGIFQERGENGTSLLCACHGIVHEGGLEDRGTVGEIVVPGSLLSAVAKVSDQVPE